MEEFIKRFADQFEDTELEAFNAQTLFHDLDEWSSLVGLAILNMIVKKYGVKLTPDDLKKAKTIQNVYDLVQNKKHD